MSFRSQMRIRWNHVRDHAGNVRARTGTGTAYRAHVAASDAWYRVAGRRIHGARQQYRNWLNRRAIERGKSPLPERLTRAAGSRLPVYRQRVNPATGRPRWTDRNREALTRWQAEQISGHVRARNEAFRAGDIGRANEAHERWRRAYTSAPQAVRARYSSDQQDRAQRGRRSR